ncbi:MAG: hypothetical protein NXI25_14905 [bacterium]|jgi:uncharacterized membrane protein YgaE (UPF0421/DUF939 family)|nr:hypothetical protein [bacterium]
MNYKNDSIVAEDKIAEVVNLLEQINKVNKMLDLHQDDEDDFMISEYQYQKKELLRQLKATLLAFNITSADLTRMVD